MSRFEMHLGLGVAEMHLREWAHCTAIAYATERSRAAAPRIVWYPGTVVRNLVTGQCKNGPVALSHVERGQRFASSFF